MTGRCNRTEIFTPNRRKHSAHAFRTRKAGFPAPRAACLFRLHRADSRSTQVAGTISTIERCIGTIQSSRPSYRKSLMPEPANAGKTGTGSRARTYDLRFWRPPLYQLSYARASRRASIAQHRLPKDFHGVCKERFAACHEHSQGEAARWQRRRPQRSTQITRR